MSSEGDTDCSSASINLSGASVADFGECDVASSKEKKAAKKATLVMMKSTQKRQLKKQQNKITKDQYNEKNLEFKTWIAETKKLNPEMLSPKKSRDLFKKFVKKWNHKKLPEQYYRGVDVLWAALGSPSQLSGWTLPTVNITPSTPCEEKLVHQYSRTSMDGLSTFGRRTGKKLLEKLTEVDSPRGHIYAEPTTPDQSAPLGSFLPETAHMSHDLEDDPGYSTIPLKRPLSQNSASNVSNISTATIHRACTRASRSASMCDVTEDLNQSSWSLASRCASIPSIPQIPEHESQPVYAEVCLDKKRKLNKQDSYVNSIENTSYVMFERRSADRKEWVERKLPPPVPKRSSSINRPPPPPRTSNLSLQSRASSVTSIAEEYIYEVPCNVDKKKMKKAKKSSEDLSLPIHGKKLPRMPSSINKGPAPPPPQKPAKSVYKDIVQQAIMAETPEKSAAEQSAPVLLKTPAGTFLVTKLTGPLKEVNDCSEC